MGTRSSFPGGKVARV